jgi:glycosyltransferase involved in cell wall biosynthesis
MKRVVYIVTGLLTGGAEIMLYKLLSMHDRNRFSPHIISLLDKGTIGPRIEQLDIPVHTLCMHSVFPTLRQLTKLAGITREINPDLILGWMYHGNLAASYAAFFCGMPPVCWNIRQTLYSLSYEKKRTALVIRCCALLSRLPTHIIYNARESVIHHESSGYRRDKSFVIPNGFDVDIFRPDDNASEKVRQELNVPTNSPLIGLIARYHPMKDHENFLRAAALLVKQQPSTHFVLVGKDVDRHNLLLQGMVESLGLSGHVHLLGERSDVPLITSALDIATSSSSYGEAFPNVVGEAMSCGVPCVVTNVGDSAWIIGDTGRVVAPSDPQLLANALLELITMGAEKRRLLGKKARQRICDNFSLDVVVRRYEALFEQLTAREGSLL